MSKHIKKLGNKRKRLPDIRKGRYEMFKKAWAYLVLVNRKYNNSLFAGLVVGLLIGLGAGLAIGLTYGLAYGLVNVLILGLCTGLVAILAVGLGAGLSVGLGAGLGIWLGAGLGTVTSIGVLYLAQVIGWMPIVAIVLVSTLTVWYHRRKKSVAMTSG